MVIHFAPYLNNAVGLCLLDPIFAVVSFFMNGGKIKKHESIDAFPLMQAKLPNAPPKIKGALFCAKVPTALY